MEALSPLSSYLVQYDILKLHQMFFLEYKMQNGSC